MPRFGKRSLDNLFTCVPPIRRWALVIVKEFDCSVVWGRRGKEAQNYAHEMGWTTKLWPESVHNVEPPELSKAIDLVPYPIDWNDKERLYYFSGWARRTAKSLGMLFRYGADWNGNFNINDQVLRDPCHFEYIRDL